ncbi:hypothetical protein CC1G_04092 [Coprinopsis cinerea okayama7|uniref:Uncharacterized protein n=1 Tax=Coprinopsis cinerea (strain Okayama-7 / 130 / ATCC MYA-4618 / FGSC 9003) TaxID=240176 RepID=A8NVY2_COPC7|nr:hypothetical protein CC1G_04092 [Coprinopsis cinerea okayama7\|eukprot:XP_001836779.2 hypothetical protein CC1G_04092 [Coprinopsis cinerea okayama7\
MLSNLPAELLAMIVQHLWDEGDGSDDVANLSTTCRKFADLSQPLLFHEVRIMLRSPDLHHWLERRLEEMEGIFTIHHCLIALNQLGAVNKLTALTIKGSNAEGVDASSITPSLLSPIARGLRTVIIQNLRFLNACIFQVFPSLHCLELVDVTLAPSASEERDGGVVSTRRLTYSRRKGEAGIGDNVKDGVLDCVRLGDVSDLSTDCDSEPRIRDFIRVLRGAGAILRNLDVDVSGVSNNGMFVSIYARAHGARQRPLAGFTRFLKHINAPHLRNVTLKLLYVGLFLYDVGRLVTDEGWVDLDQELTRHAVNNTGFTVTLLFQLWKPGSGFRWDSGGREELETVIKTDPRLNGLDGWVDGPLTSTHIKVLLPQTANLALVAYEQL